ncbi:MAG: hypothetical protein Fur0018_27750 [Anaerolineales bacterium]
MLGALPQRWAPPFFTIWTGQAFSLFGSQLVQFALIWYLTRQTGSATVLATASLVGMLPQIVIGPFAGALVDRWSRRVVMIVSDSLAALFALGVVQTWHIYLLMGVRAIAGAFQWPAMQAATSLMVPKAHLSRIQGLNQMLNGALSIVAAPLGALLIDLLPMQGILAIDVSTAFFAVAPLFFVRVPEPQHRVDAPAEKPSVWADVRAGVAYVWRWPGLAILLGMALLINFLLTPAFALLPLLVKAHFGRGAMALGWMEAVSGVGMVLAGPLADRLGEQVWFLAGGVLTAVTGVAAFFIPAIVNIEETRQPPKAGVQPLIAD